MIVKHVGKHGDRKVAIVFREVPGEDHMCLVVYPETLPVNIHDGLMRVLESPEGQSAENFGDVLFRSLLPDGRPILQTLHHEGMIKKVQAKLVVVTPNPSSHVNLEEMNNILREMKLGEDAVKRLADLDTKRGMTGAVNRRDDYGREIGAPGDNTRGANVADSVAARAALQAPQTGALDDGVIANNLRTQAERMASEAKQLLEESNRLMKEAATLSGVKPETATEKTKTTARSKKVKTANAA
jgi:hypothetical protein